MTKSAPPTERRIGPAIFSGFSPIVVLPGQCAMTVIVSPMNTIPSDMTRTRIEIGLQRGGEALL